MTSALFVWAFIQSFISGSVISLVKRTATNYVLSGIFWALSLNILFQYVFRYTDIKYNYPSLLFVNDVFDFLLPGLILWYVNLLFNRAISQRHYWYFLPAAIFFTVLLTYVLVRTDLTFNNYIGTPIHKFTLTSIVIWKGFVVHRIYVLLQEKTKSLTSKTSLLQWPRVLMVFVAFACFVALVQLAYHAVFVPYFEASTVERLRHMVQLNYILFSSSIILVTIYFPIKYPKILSGEPLVKSTPGVDVSEGEIYREKLYKLIREDQVHLDSELNEKALADRLGVHLYVLSRLLNDYLGKSFSQFINEERVNAAKKMLACEQNKELTNFAVAVDSGFRSESVFYANFKKITGMTPRQYKKSSRKE